MGVWIGADSLRKGARVQRGLGKWGAVWPTFLCEEGVS